MRVGTVHRIQALVKGRRKDLGLSQATVAQNAQVSRKWLSEFERGVTTAAELPLVLRLLDALALDIEITVRGEAPRSGSNEPDTHDADLDAVLRNYAGSTNAPSV